MKYNLTYPIEDMRHEELKLLYEEALDIISNLTLEIRELKQEINDYCEGYDYLMDELSKYR